MKSKKTGRGSLAMTPIATVVSRAEANGTREVQTSPYSDEMRQVIESIGQQTGVPDLTPERLQPLTTFPLFGTEGTPPEDSGPMILLNLGGLLAEQSFTFTDNDGTEWTWAVTRAREHAASLREVANFTYGEYGVDEEMVIRQYPSLDREYAITTDLSNPVLLILFQGKLLCIDGWHRLWKAMQTGIKTVPALLLFEEEAEQFLMSCVTLDGVIHWGKLMTGKIFQLVTDPPADLVFSEDAASLPNQAGGNGHPASGFYICSATGREIP